jgi:hypothetical protein
MITLCTTNIKARGTFVYHCGLKGWNVFERKLIVVMKDFNIYASSELIT